MEISKSALLLTNEHRSDQKNVTNDFRMNFHYVFRSCKNDSINGMQENVASRRTLTKMTASVFHRL